MTVKSHIAGAIKGWAGEAPIDLALHQAVRLCTMMLPKEKRSVEHVVAVMEHLMERALVDMRKNAKAYGLTESSQAGGSAGEHDSGTSAGAPSEQGEHDEAGYDAEHAAGDPSAWHAGASSADPSSMLQPELDVPTAEVVSSGFSTYTPPSPAPVPPPVPHPATLPPTLHPSSPGHPQSPHPAAPAHAAPGVQARPPAAPPRPVAPAPRGPTGPFRGAPPAAGKPRLPGDRGFRR
jgi:hypothetical protein